MLVGIILILGVAVSYLLNYVRKKDKWFEQELDKMKTRNERLRAELELLVERQQKVVGGE